MAVYFAYKINFKGFLQAKRQIISSILYAKRVTAIRMGAVVNWRSLYSSGFAVILLLQYGL
jgi:hypothetical protein